MARNSRVPALVFGGLAAITGVVSAWFGAETYLLSTRKHPETWYIRNQLSWHPKLLSLGLVLLGFTVGAAVTHFSWDESAHYQ